MVIVKPFKATILNPEIPNRDKLICPVYDTINESEYVRYGGEKNNIIHVTTRRGGTDSQKFIKTAKKVLTRFFNHEVLKERDQPAFYIYGLRYTLPDEILGQIPDRAKRDVYFAFGLVALVEVEGLGEGNIVGHERIFAQHTDERYDLMKACAMNFAPIVSEYNMPNHEINNIFEHYLGFKRPDLILRDDKPPLVDASLNGTRHLLWEISDHEIIGRIQKLMADKKVLILDGHHRYTAAHKLSMLNGVEHTMMMFMEGGDRALLLLPWHRCMRHADIDRMEALLERYYDVIWKGGKDDFEFYALLNARDDRYDVRIGWYDGKDFSVLMARRDAVKSLSGMLGQKVGLDYISLNEWIISPCTDGNNVEDIVFCDSVMKAVHKVNNGGFDAAFLMRPLQIEEVEYKAHVEMKNFPQKSTLFLPKVAEGILMRRFGE